MRQVELAGAPAAAIWDHATQEIVVVGRDVGGARATWRAPAPGSLARDVQLADLIGSPAQDLVVVMQGGAGDTVLVYPDVGLPGPEPRWAPGSPGTPVRGLPHTVSVALDPSGAATAALSGSPACRRARRSRPARATPSPCRAPCRRRRSSSRCGRRTRPARFDELPGALPVVGQGIALALVGASPLVLEPGGVTTAVFDASLSACGTTSFTGALPAGAFSVDVTLGPISVRRTITLPAVSYPALLAGPALGVSLATTDPDVDPSTVALAVPLDGSQLVEVSHGADRSALVDGDVVVLRTTLRSRLGVALPAVRVVDVLAGFVPAGPPTVTGAAVVSVAADGAELVLDALPAAPGEVTIVLPVRGAGGRGASGVEARSSGGWLLTPRALSAVATPLPGCGCGAGSGPGALALLAVALVARRRRAT